MVNKLNQAFEENPLAWMNEQGKTRDLPYLLAFADDGIIRGKQENGAYVLTTNVKLRSGTLQRAHLFGKSGELRITRADSGFEEVWLDDSSTSLEELLKEDYVLWNEAPDKAGQLTVQHYIQYDEQGQAYISHSRLVSVKDS